MNYHNIKPEFWSNNQIYEVGEYTELTAEKLNDRVSKLITLIKKKGTIDMNITMTDEQFKELIQTIRGAPIGGSIASPTLPEDNEMCMRFAMELLQTVARDNWYGDTSDRPKWKTLRAEIMKIAREYI